MAEMAAEQAAKPFFQRAGELLNECKAQVEHGHWEAFIREHFEFSVRTARVWMQYARELPEFQNGRDASDFSKPPTRSEIQNPDRDRSAEYQKGWQSAVRKTTSTLNVSKLKQEYEDKKKENKVIRELAVQLIDMGSKVLATKLHPDKGGSSEAMHRLNEIRRGLKQCAEDTWSN
jgi:hypothetical protein